MTHLRTISREPLIAPAQAQELLVKGARVGLWADTVALFQDILDLVQDLLGRD